MSAMSSARYDIGIIGGGPGGYATALRATAHGLRVVLIEADRIGGTCLHRGCVPSKALLHVAHLADQVARSTELGLAGPGPGVDVAAVARFRDTTVDQLFRGLGGLLAQQKIDVVRGRGRIDGPGRIVVDGEAVIDVRHVVVATGSTPVQLPIAPSNGDTILVSDDALRLERVPETAVIVGGGAIGVEFASMWCSLGAQVTLVEAAPRVLPLEDPETSVAVARAFRRRGITVKADSTLVRTAVGTRSVAAVLATAGIEEPINADQLLVAVGRRPLTHDLGLDEPGLLDERGFVRVDAYGRSRMNNVWAVGDVVDTLALAHAAFAEGFVVADMIAGVPTSPVDHALTPRVTYCSPEVAAVGLTEPEARNRFDDVSTTVSTFAGNARALIEGVSGHAKLIHRADGTLVGAHIVGPSATELIAELGLAVTWQALVGELGQVVHAHPSLSENIREVALMAAGIPFHTHGRGPDSSGSSRGT